MNNIQVYMKGGINFSIKINSDEYNNFLMYKSNNLFSYESICIIDTGGKCYEFSTKEISCIIY